MTMRPVRTLREWRRIVGDGQVIAFIRALEALPGFRLSPSMRKRLGGDAHLGLLTDQPLVAALTIGKNARVGKNTWGQPVFRDLGHVLAARACAHGGALADADLTSEERDAAATLAGRGVLFPQDEYWHLPAEIIAQVDAKNLPEHSLFRGVGLLQAKFLRALVPEEARQAMSGPQPLASEIQGWLLARATTSLTDFDEAALGESDWNLLLRLERGPMDDWEEMRRFFPDARAIHKDSGGWWREEQVVDVRASLEQHPPEALRRLMLAGCLLVRFPREYGASPFIYMPDEAARALRRPLRRQRNRALARLRDGWRVDAPKDCLSVLPEGDHDLWRLWVAVHFLPPELTKSGAPRKNALKRLAVPLGADPDDLENRLQLLNAAGLIESVGHPPRLEARAPASTVAASGDLRDFLWHSLLFHAPRHRLDSTQPLELLAELPADEWLDARRVATWLALRSPREDPVDWPRWLHLGAWFHDVSGDGNAVRFRPMLAALVRDEDVLVAPGWRGLDANAPVQGFIGADGVIRVPPECRAEAWRALAGFCRLESVEHMITLRLDEAALRRMAARPGEVARARRALEALASPLPQPVAHLLDRCERTESPARAAAASMVFLMRDAAWLARMRKAGFTLHQPFDDHPEIVLLDADDDPEAFLAASAEAGAPLETLLPPKRWISSQAALKAWMENHARRSRAGEASIWVELVAQRARNASPRRLLAAAGLGWDGQLEITVARQTRKGWRLNKPVRMRLNHIVRLRELSAEEARALGLVLDSAATDEA